MKLFRIDYMFPPVVSEVVQVETVVACKTYRLWYFCGLLVCRYRTPWS